MVSQNIPVALALLCLVICCGECVKILGEKRQVSDTTNSKKTFVDKLKGNLLKNYDRESRPNPHFNATLVNLGLTITHIEVSEATSTVTFYVWPHLVWDDNKLKWNPSDYGGLNYLNLSPSEIWWPDIFLLNSAVSSPVFWTGTHLRAYSNGRILWVPPSRLSILCDLNLKYWPYDVQKCYLKFSSWTSRGDEIDLQLYNNYTSVYMSDIIVSNNQWQISEASAERIIGTSHCCMELPYVIYNITLVRNSPAYKYLIFTPTVVVMVFTLIPFWLVPDDYGKIYTHSITLLIICVLFSYFTQKLPSMGDHTPLIVSFYSQCLWVVSLAMIESIAVIWMVSTSHSGPVPWRIKKYFMGKLGSFTGFIPKTRFQEIPPMNNREEEMRDHQVATTGRNDSDLRQIIDFSEKHSFQQEWISFARAIDKLVFIFYCFLFLILVIATLFNKNLAVFIFMYFFY